MPSRSYPHNATHHRTPLLYFLETAHPGPIQRGLTDWASDTLCRLLPTVPPPEASVGRKKALEVFNAIASTSLPFRRHRCRLASHPPWVAVDSRHPAAPNPLALWARFLSFLKPISTVLSLARPVYLDLKPPGTREEACILLFYFNLLALSLPSRSSVNGSRDAVAVCPPSTHKIRPGAQLPIPVL